MVYLALLAPFAFLILINLFPGSVREKWSFGLCVLTYLAQFVMALFFLFGFHIKLSLFELDNILRFNLHIYRLGSVLLLSTGLIGLTSLLVARGVITSSRERFNFTNLMFIALVGMNGIAMVSDLFSLYVFIELTAAAAFILILLQRSRQGYEGALKYLILSVAASVLMLSSVALFMLIAGDTSFMAIRAAALSSPNQLLAKAALIFFVCGLFIKAGLVPFHGWVPDAYTGAPAPVSILLAGIITKASGLYPLMRIFMFIPPSSSIKDILMVVGMLSIFVGALSALGQKNMRRMLSYSSISQMGYIVIALASGTSLGYFAALFHFFNHAIFKAQLFANAAAVEKAAGSGEMDNLGGLAQRMPVTGTTAAIASLSTAGIPPLSGFWSKLLIILALWMAGYYFYAVLAVLASVITLAYFLLLQRKVFFGKVPDTLSKVEEVGWMLRLPVIILSAITVGVGLAAPFMLKFLMR